MRWIILPIEILFCCALLSQTALPPGSVTQQETTTVPQTTTPSGNSSGEEAKTMNEIAAEAALKTQLDKDVEKFNTPESEGAKLFSTYEKEYLATHPPDLIERKEVKKEVDLSYLEGHWEEILEWKRIYKPLPLQEVYQSPNFTSNPEKR